MGMGSAIEIKNKQIVIDGEPAIIMCGEIHYYRLDRKDWQDRITKLVDAGCNAVASYVPWLCHEPYEGKFDLDGSTRPELDLGAFIDLCHENDLYFFVRPGPFIMAEMKNEGIPYWVYEKHPEIIPVAWDNKKVPTSTIDYLAPNFLKAARNWYKAVMSVIEPRLITNGGNIIGVQLDNEIGMLSWVSNSPDLTDFLLDDFTAWLNNQYSNEELTQRYPFNLNSPEIRNSHIRSPKEDYTAALHKDLGYFMRNRFARYIDELRSYSEEFGIKDIPFVVNIHGTSGGRGFTYPIGISQLYESYTQAPGYLSGSDIYFEDLTMNNFQDLYLINGFMDAVHTPDQPLTSVEFNCGDGNFGSTFGGRYDPSAADFKIRMCLAQGNRLINYYLFTGGYNYRLDTMRNDGNDRVAFTGERHGFAAPVSPEGELNYTYPRMKRVTKTVMAVSKKLAAMNEEHDDVSFAFIPDYYMTEYRYPNSEKMKEILTNIEANRAYGAWEIMARAMLISGYRFGAADIQNQTLDPKKTPVLAIPSARYMSREIQQKLASYLLDGGKMLLFGEVPQYDMEGKPCSVLSEVLDVKPAGSRKSSEHYYLSVCAEGWAAPRPEVRSNFSQTFKLGNNADSILSIYGTEESCGFDSKVGTGRAIVIATAYSCDVDLFKQALEKLGAKAKLVHDFKHHGIFMTSAANQHGERMLHLLNLDGLDKEFHIYDQDEKLFNGRKILLQSKDGVMLPLNMTYDEVKIVYSTAEIVNVERNQITFRLTQPKDIITFETDKEILYSDEYNVERTNNRLIVRSNKHAKVDDSLTVKFR